MGFIRFSAFTSPTFPIPWEEMMVLNKKLVGLPMEHRRSEEIATATSVLSLDESAGACRSFYIYITQPVIKYTGWCAVSCSGTAWLLITLPHLSPGFCLLLQEYRETSLSLGHSLSLSLSH
jgi:hypothetical protein